MLQRRLRSLIGLALTLVFAAHSAGWLPLPVIDRLESWAYDYRLLATLPGGVDPRVVIVDIDARSLAVEGHWPWSRDKLARLVDRLFDAYQIGILGVDVVFAEYDDRSGLAALDALAEGPLAGNRAYLDALRDLRPQLDQDRRFAQSLRDRDVILGFSAARDTRSGRLPTPLMQLEGEAAGLSFFQVQGYNANLPELQQAAYGGGFFDNPAVDADGLFRRSPLVYRIDDALYGSLAFAVVHGLYGQPQLELDVQRQGGRPVLEGIGFSGVRVPVDPQGVAPIPYRGAYGSFRYVSATDVLRQTVPKPGLEGVIALLGATAPGLMDLRASPVGARFPGVEIQANLIAGLLSGDIKQRPGYALAVNTLLILGLGLVLGFVLPRLSPIPILLLSAGGLAVLLAFNLWLWQNLDLILPLAGPVALLALLVMFHTAWGFFAETRRKRRLGRLFGQYVPPEIVEEMDRNESDSFGLEGESREMTVLFADVRSFTTLSEGLKPDELKQLMNAYFTQVTEVIHDHRGTIDKYIGDAIMAFWGAPLHDPEHARHGLEAALAMQRRMQQVRAEFRRRGWPEIRIGCGVNSGVMNVGNMGSAFRMSYTVMGDAVNLGSRLEGLTKAYGVEIMISESTRKGQPELICRELDRVRVKGKKAPVGVFEPLGLPGELDSGTLEPLERYHQALAAYRSQNWRKAEVMFEALRLADPNSKLYALYLERVQDFKANPPGADWDAVATFLTK